VIPEAGFEVVLRGYNRQEVDAFVDVVQTALRADDPSARLKALEGIGGPAFAVTMRGYNKRQVDDYVIAALAALRGTKAE
jgi:DivIVA domain-containing protein